MKKEIETLGKKLIKLTDSIQKGKKAAKKTPARKTSVKKKTTLKKKVAVKKTIAKKTAKKAVKTATASETVYKAIPRSKKGVDVATLIKKTGFDRRKIYDNVKVLKKQGKVKSVGTGVYGKA
ncbi:MAG: hypothetical protein JRI91_02770 [Deltaproteobacteria bacterium]|nr:hypothetical protein [Deltaproteobacteria bacterium]